MPWRRRRRRVSVGCMGCTEPPAEVLGCPEHGAATGRRPDRPTSPSPPIWALTRGASSSSCASGGSRPISRRTPAAAARRSTGGRPSRLATSPASGSGSASMVRRDRERSSCELASRRLDQDNGRSGSNPPARDRVRALVLHPHRRRLQSDPPPKAARSRGVKDQATLSINGGPSRSASSKRPALAPHAIKVQTTEDEYGFVTLVFRAPKPHFSWFSWVPTHSPPPPAEHKLLARVMGATVGPYTVETQVPIGSGYEDRRTSYAETNPKGEERCLP